MNTLAPRRRWTPYCVVASEEVFVETQLSLEGIAQRQQTAAATCRHTASCLAHVKQNAGLRVNAYERNIVV